MTTYVLVHGAWHGPWCWDLVGPALVGYGHSVLAPELPLTGMRANLAKLESVIEQVEGPYVLCGHSGAGHLLTGLGPRLEMCERLVYISGILLDFAGQSIPNRRSTLIDDALQMDGDVVRVRPEAAVDLFYGDCSPELALTAVSRLRPTSLHGECPPPDQPGWQIASSTYVVCTEDRSIHPDDQREMAAERASTIIEWPSGHVPQLSRPADVIALLLESSGSA